MRSGLACARLCATPLGAIALLATTLASACLAQGFSIEAPACEAPGTSIDVVVRANSGGTPQGAAQFHLYFDQSAWMVDVAFAAGGFRLESGWNGIVNATLPGEVFAALWHLPAEPTGLSTLLTVRLINVAGAGPLQFDCDVDQWADPSFVSIIPVPFSASPVVTTIGVCFSAPPSCSIVTPMAGSTLMGSQVMTYDLMDPENDPCTITYEFDKGMGFQPATRVGGGPSMETGVLPAAGRTFPWNIAADFTLNRNGVPFRITANDGSSSASCTVVLNILAPNLPTNCAFTTPPPSGGAVLPQAIMTYSALDGNGDLLTITHEFNGGSGFMPASRRGGGSHVSTGVTPGQARNFSWDAATDVGVPASGVLFRITLNDGRGSTAVCTVTVDVMNAGGTCPLVASSCGDCNLDGMRNILDALLAAQIAASVLGPSPAQFDACNATGLLFPDPAAAVNILDALIIAQFAAGLPVVVACC